MNDYIKIDWADVRPGDVLMHDNGDRLTVQSFGGLQEVRTTAGLYWPSEYKGSGFHPYRKRPELPTEPGAYLDKVRAEAWDEGHEAAAMRVPEGVWADVAEPHPGNPYRKAEQ